jgi:hypothetical protein
VGRSVLEEPLGDFLRGRDLLELSVCEEPLDRLSTS